MSEPKLPLNRIGELPLVRRLHQAVAVGLAVFMLTLVVLREPFHGYLAEIHISGPATPGLDLDEAGQWLKKAEPHLAVIATPAGEISPKCEIRATYVSRHPQPATVHLDELAERWLYQYLPDRLQTYRHQVLSNLRSAVAAVRQREDAAHQRLEALRQQQLVEAKEQGTGDRGQGTGNEGPRLNTASLNTSSATTAAQPSTEKQKAEAKLHDLKLELSNRLASHTEEHPEVITLKSRISALEKRLGTGDGGDSPASVNSLDPMVPGDGGPSLQAPNKATTGPVIRRMSGELPADANGPALGSGGQSRPGHVSDDDVPAQIAAAIGELASATRDRQAAELRLSERMQELSDEPTAAQWSAGPAHIVTRLGGTPRALTLALAGVLACAVGIAMFRLTAVELLKPRVATTGELSELLGVPVLGTVPGNSFGSGPARRQAPAPRPRLFTARRLELLTYCAEGFVAIAAGACLISVMIDPSLIREVLADPFGTLSEVLGRCMG